MCVRRKDGIQDHVIICLKMLMILFGLAKRGRGGTGTLRSVRNLSVVQFSDAMVLLVTGVLSAALHGSVTSPIPVYYTGAFISLPLLLTIAGISFAVFKRVQVCANRSEIPPKIAPLMKAYCVCLTLSWPSWFVAMMITGIAGICRNSGCSYSVNRTGNYILAIVILVCIGVAFFANIFCTMSLYVFCAEMGLSIYGSRRIRVGGVQSDAGPSFTNVSPMTTTTESQTVPSPRTSTAQCQTQPAFSVHDSFQPYPDAKTPRKSNKSDITSSAWTIPPDTIPTEQELLNLTKQYHKGKKKGSKKRKQKLAKYKQTGRNGIVELSPSNLDDSAIFSPSGVHIDTYNTHIDSYGDPGEVLLGSPRKQLTYYRYGSQSPPSRETHSPDYLHVQLPNAPSPTDRGISFQVSYRPFERTRNSTPPIRIPTATPPLSYSPPSPTLVTAWKDSTDSASSSPPVRCNTPQPNSSFSSDTPFGEPYLPTLRSRYVATPPPSTSPTPVGVLYNDFDDDDSPPFSP